MQLLSNKILINLIKIECILLFTIQLLFILILIYNILLSEYMVLLLVKPLVITMHIKKRGAGRIGQKTYCHYHKKVKWTMEDYCWYWESRLVLIFDDDIDEEDHSSSSTPSVTPSNKTKTISTRMEMVIAFIHEEIMLSPPREEWQPKDENGGTITKIMKLLNMKRRSRSVVKKC